MPQRIQRKRSKGWRMPEGAVYVGRPSKWGNPFQVYKCDCCQAWDVRDENGVTYLIDHTYDGPNTAGGEGARLFAVRESVRLFVDLFGGGALFTERSTNEVRSALAGKDLSCWCPLDQPCHADVLLEIANTV